MSTCKWTYWLGSCSRSRAERREGLSEIHRYSIIINRIRIPDSGCSVKISRARSTACFFRIVSCTPIVPLSDLSISVKRTGAHGWATMSWTLGIGKRITKIGIKKFCVAGWVWRVSSRNSNQHVYEWAMSDIGKRRFPYDRISSIESRQIYGLKRSHFRAL